MNASSECLLIRELSQSFEYNVLMAVKGVLCWVGAVRVALQWKNHGVRFLIHDNTKILFCFFLALNIIISAIFGFIHLMELVRIRFDCFLLDFRYNLLTIGVGISLVVASHLVILLLSFERLYSALFPAHFEKHSCNSFAVLLAVTVISGTLVNTIRQLSNGFQLFYERIEVALINVNIPENEQGFKDVMHFMALTNCLSILTLCIDLYINFARKAVNGASLAVSYQRAENRRIVLILLPIELTQALMGTFTSFSLLIYGEVVSSPSAIGQQLFIGFTSISVYFPLLLTVFMKLSARRMYVRAKKTVKVTPELDHFEALRRSWE